MVVGLAQTVSILGSFGAVFALVLAIYVWLKQPYNPAFTVLVVVSVLFAIATGIGGGSGRRYIVSSIFAIPASLYWFRYRDVPKVKTVAILGIIVILGVLFVNGYSSVRHRPLREGEQKTVVRMIQLVQEAAANSLNMAASAQMLGQNAVEVSLTCIHLYGDAYPHEPFHSFVFIVANPIPRQFWPDKPVGLGYLVPRQYGQGTRVTWGPGIVGHGFHEGGLFFLVFYGVLAGAFLAFMDELLVEQPRNPYIIGMLAAMSGQLIAWPRGDIGTFSVQIIAAMIVAIVFGIIGRIFFGNGLIYGHPGALGVQAPAMGKAGSLV